jgi:hypothetical protein
MTTREQPMWSSGSRLHSPRPVTLEQQWSRGQEASTEDLRVALMHYREFFDRLLAA